MLHAFIMHIKGKFQVVKHLLVVVRERTRCHQGGFEQDLGGNLPKTRDLRNNNISKHTYFFDYRTQNKHFEFGPGILFPDHWTQF